MVRTCFILNADNFYFYISLISFWIKGLTYNVEFYMVV